MNMANLKPDVLFSQWCGWHRNYVSETLQESQTGVTSISLKVAYLETLLIFLLLLVDYSQTEINFVRLLKIWLHTHDLRECFFGML
jgi:hypothetical protein